VHFASGLSPANDLLGIGQGSSDADLLAYWNGHGGDGFLKFRDWEELASSELARAVLEGRRRGVHRRSMHLLDTC